ncbi:UNVERIFIED_CONTAM: hypothetical protein NCL1_03780 [Trichonephila clavipes]
MAATAAGAALSDRTPVRRHPCRVVGAGGRGHSGHRPGVFCLPRLSSRRCNLRAAHCAGFLQGSGRQVRAHRSPVRRRVRRLQGRRTRLAVCQFCFGTARRLDRAAHIQTDAALMGRD